MRILRKIFDFYLDGSIHVALSCFSLVQITLLYFNIPKDLLVANFAFFGTIASYNFVKYESFVRTKKDQIRKKFKAILVLFLLSLIVAVLCFFQLERISQIISIVFLILTLLYALPFFPNKKNARNWAGVKIYIVAFSWVGVTVALPVLNASISITPFFFLICIQQFILFFVLILIFEIIDLAQDDPNLQTVPQQIGLKQTKILGYVLLVVFCVLAFYERNIHSELSFFPLLLVFVITIVTALFLAFANENRSKYYTSFWVESVPILWWLMLVFFQ
jgi:hypothetical protein